MRAFLQRVSKASVKVDNKSIGAIDIGFLIFLGIEHEDTDEDIDWLVNKCINLRVFSDRAGKMNDSIHTIGGSFLVISQFTLHASTKKGNRPSFMKASRPEHAIPMYENFCNQLEMKSELIVKQGIFGAEMQVDLINNGPVTILLDSKNRE